MCQDSDTPFMGGNKFVKLEKAIHDDILHEVKVILDSIIESKNDLAIIDLEWKMLLETAGRLKRTEIVQLMHQYEEDGFEPFSGCILGRYGPMEILKVHDEMDSHPISNAEMIEFFESLDFGEEFMKKVRKIYGAREDKDKQ